MALNKADIPDAREIAEMVRADVEARGLTTFVISTKSGLGLQALTFAMAQVVADRRARLPQPAPAPIVIRPAPVRSSGDDFTIVRQGDGDGGFVWRVRGLKPERWVRQTDFSNPEAVGYLADRLNRLGVEDKLLEVGALPGDAVAIGGEDAVVFDFAPQVEIGAEALGRRGEDDRLIAERESVIRRRQADADYHAAREERGDYGRHQTRANWRAAGDDDLPGGPAGTDGTGVGGTPDDPANGGAAPNVSDSGADA